MKKNMGLIDKVIRITVAIVMIVLGFILNDTHGIISILLYIFAGIFILTSLISFCPLYLPFGINTGKKE